MVRRLSAVAVLALVPACPVLVPGSTSTSTTASTSSGADEESDIGASADTGESDTNASDTTTAGTTSAATTADTGSTTGFEPPPPRLCSLEEIDPSTDPATVIDYGDGADQIPTVIGELLLRNCGCHYTDNVQPGPLVDYKSNAQPMATLADFHGNYTGILPEGYEDMPAHIAVQERVVNSNPLPMPPHMCQVENEPGPITMADQALLSEWLAAAAPDGASFP